MSYQTRTSLVHPRVAYRVETRWTSAFELLVGMFATGTPSEGRDESWAPRRPRDCPPRTRDALAAIGNDAGEVWLHVLGLPLDEPVAAAGLAALVAKTDALELRRYLVGEHVPAWRSAVGADTLAAAAEGDTAAARRLLRDDCYYGGRARESLRTLLPLSPEETRARLVEAVAAYAEEVFAPVEASVTVRLEAAVAHAAELGGSVGDAELIDRLCGGYKYEPETGLGTVVLVPHLAARPWLLLCQHRDARVICHPVEGQAPFAERLVRIGRALGDERRVAIVERLRRGEATLQELADELGLAKSTVHHHVVQLRAARLIALSGNASRYAYVLEEAGFAEAQRLLGELRP